MTDNSTSFELPNQDNDLIYSFAASQDCEPGKSGIIFSARSSGLYRSINGGITWHDALESLSLSETLPITALSISPNFHNDRIVLAGAPGGIFYSSDSGQTWKALIFPNPPPTVSFLSFSPSFESDETVFAGTMEDGVFISQNGGERWVAWNFGLLDLNVMCVAISPAFQHDETVFAGTETGIFRSTNGGRAWREIDLPFGFEAVLSLMTSPTYEKDGLIYAGTESQGLWVSHDFGESWERIGEEFIDDPINSIQIINRTVFVITSSSIWQTKDDGRTWRNLLPISNSEREFSTALVVSTDNNKLSVITGLMNGELDIQELT